MFREVTKRIDRFCSSIKKSSKVLIKFYFHCILLFTLHFSVKTTPLF